MKRYSVSMGANMVLRVERQIADMIEKGVSTKTIERMLRHEGVDKDLVRKILRDI
jgi:SOS response regulatory protein OraA/RecX